MVEIIEGSAGKRLRAVPTKGGVELPVDGPISWSTSDPSVLTIEAPTPEGPAFARVTLAGGKGPATITASYKGQTATVDFDVVAAEILPDGLSIEVSELE